MQAQPPKRALKFLRWFCREDFIDEIEGDLVEIFEMHYEEDPKQAVRSFWWQVLLHFRPDYIKTFTSVKIINNDMLKSNFKIAWRHVFKKKLYSFINITGLGVGLASCMLIALFINYELSYDTYHENLDGIYRVLHGYKKIEDQKIALKPEDFKVWGNAPVAEAMQRDWPEVKTTFRFTSPTNFLFEYEDKIFQEDNMVYADSTAFEIFSWKMLYGDPATALDEPFTVVLTEKIAEKYFGKEDPVGKSIKIGSETLLKVTGVMENVPSNSHFTFDGMVSMGTFRKFQPSYFEMWGYIDFYTYFTLHNNASITSLEQKSTALAQRYTSDWENSLLRWTASHFIGANNGSSGN